MIDGNGGAAISQHGFVYSKTVQTPTLTDSKTELGATSGPFPLTLSRNLTGLEANTTYYVRAFATNSTGTGYGAVGQVKTSAANLPNMGTAVPTASGITTEGAQLNGVILGQGDGPISQYGFVYNEQSTATSPTLENSQKIELGALPTTAQFQFIYSRQLTGLKTGTGYSFRAFATNVGGTTYGPVGSFTTLAVTATTDFDGTVFVTAPGSLIALDAKTGTQKWVIQTPNTSDLRRLDQTYPVVIGASVFWTDREKLYRTNYNTQEAIWSFTLPGSGSLSSRGSSPLAGGGQLHLISDGKLVTVNTSTGARIGTDLTFGNTTTDANVLAGGIFYTTLAGLQAIVANTDPKTSRWKVPFTISDTPSNLLLSNGLLIGCAGSNTGKLVTFDAATGAKKWEYLTGSSFEDGFPTVANGIVYLPGAGRTFHAVDAQTGVRKWTFINPYNGDLSNNGADVSEGVVYVSVRYSNGQGGLFALDAQTGSVKWEAQNTGQLSSPVVAGNVIFAASSSYVAAFNKATGQQIWRRLIAGQGSQLSAPTVVDASGNTVFYPANSGMKQ